jgi:hypothetical protein
MSKMLKIEQTPIFTASIMLSRRKSHGNLIDRSFGGVFAWWRRLGIHPLAQITEP